MKVLEKNERMVRNDHLAKLYKVMLDHGDFENANKIVDLYEKKQNGNFHVSFTGHFSAGKSSLINFFLNKDLLPKSPIPTSANIVKITSGLGVARVFFNETKPVEYEEPYDIDMIKDYCMNKDTIKQIEIHTKDRLLPEGTFIVDTPGIDAADDADRYMTESSLHLVDVLYYVMDYNHVQSEVNFNFLKNIQEKNIPIYIIINQIDKHNENELTFESFVKSVKDTFVNWQIFPERIYFSSMKNRELHNNEVQTIKADLFDLLENHPNNDERIALATFEVVRSHKLYLEERMEEEASQLNLREFDEEKWEAVRLRLQQLDALENQFVAEYTEELNQTLKNAYLMPAKLRDLALHFLESTQKGFKVGLFQAKKKTEVEKQVRLANFLEQVQQSIQSTIQWKLREKYANLLQAYQITNEQIASDVQNLHIDYTAEDLLSFVKEGATINGNYVLNYTNEISNDIKQKYRREANRLLENIKRVIQDTTKVERDALIKEKQAFEAINDQLEQKEQLQNDFEQKVNLLESVFETSFSDEKLTTQLELKLKERNDFIKEEVPTITVEERNVTPDEKEIVASTNISDVQVDGQFIRESIDCVIATIEDLPSFQSMVNELKEKKTRLENRSLTIALFGAFSAGKSSFSNALLGERILPVSPNPTTAVINRITPVTDTNPHGTVLISYKSEQLLMDDLITITKDFDKSFDRLDDLVAWVKREKVYESDLLTKTYQSYLTAILKGYEQRSPRLGKQETITMDQFAAYVTDESIAAYIEAVDLFYDCSLTQRGITLVDTPGADSVNARHTNVAFDYIKDADAIIYVTYYNHAVTSADRDFLMQLGRVKESFALDKMFFIVNAADLAEDEMELALVLNYVNDQLLQYGIRNPQIYPLSSKQSIEDKKNNRPLNEQMQTFEAQFYKFIEHDLQKLTYQAAMWDMKRAENILTNFVQSLTLDEKARKQRILDLEAKKTQGQRVIDDKSITNIIERTKERIKRQLHFVNERFYIRFHDMFVQYFNPTTITENGRKAIVQLEKNRNQLVDYIGYELLQETRAVSLRLEAFMNERLSEFYKQISNELLTIDELMTLPSFEPIRFHTPDYTQAFTQLNMDIFKDTLKIFKNLRSFFEQNDREKMKESFYETLKGEIVAYLNTQQEVMKQAYLEQLQSQVNHLLGEVETEINTIIDEQIHLLKEKVDFEKLQQKLNVLQNINEHLEVEKIG